MGANHRKLEGRAEMRKRDAENYVAGRAVSLAENRRANTERQLGIEEELLGSDAQVAGTLGGPSEELRPFLGRYTFDSVALGLKTHSNDNRELPKGYLDARTKIANELMGRAEAAARAGDFTEANRLKQFANSSLTAGGEIKKQLQAEGIDKKYLKSIEAYKGWVRNDKWGSLSGIAGIESIFELVEDPAIAARAKLGNPQALIVGKQLQESRKFQDFNSVESINERKLMTDPAERALAAGERSSVRQSRIGAMGQGYASNPNARAISEERTARSFSADRAQLHSQVAQQFQQIQRQYAKDNVAFARDFLQGGAGIRENFQGAMDGINQNFANLSQQAAQMNQQMSITSSGLAMQAEQMKQQKQMQYASLAVSALGMILGAMTGGVGGALVAGAAAKANSQRTSTMA